MTPQVFFALTAHKILDADAAADLYANITAIEAMYTASKIKACDVARMLSEAARKAETETESRRIAREAS